MKDQLKVLNNQEPQEENTREIPARGAVSEATENRNIPALHFGVHRIERHGFHLHQDLVWSERWNFRSDGVQRQTCLKFR